MLNSFLIIINYVPVVEDIRIKYGNKLLRKEAHLQVENMADFFNKKNATLLTKNCAVCCQYS